MFASLTPGTTAETVYSVFGTADSHMSIPPAFQVATPFGANLGGANPAFFAFSPDAEFDSWLTAGITGGDTNGALSSIGIEFAAWTESDGLEVADGAVFWMSPPDSLAGDSVVAQITVPSGSSGQMTAGLQGRSTGGDDAEDWQQQNVMWAYP